jgi:hypothetical protein
MRNHHMHMARLNFQNNLPFSFRKGIQDVVILKRLTAVKLTKFGGILRIVTNISERGYISLSN